MTDYGNAAMDVLAPAIAAARRALARLEPEEIPSSVKKVAAYSGGRLPPPLARSLVAALDTDEWLRAKAAGELTDAGSDDPAPATAFITRPDGWWASFAVEVETNARQRAELELRNADEKIAKLEKKVAAARARGKEKGDRRAGRDAAAAKQHAKAEKQLRSKAEAAARRAAVADRVAAETASQLEFKNQAHADAQRELARMRDRARKIRSSKSRRSGASEPGLTRNPLELAKHLDRLAQLAAMSRDMTSAGPAVESVEAKAKLPPGISPDSEHAVRWLIEQDQPFTLVIDGYNVLYLLDSSDFSSGVARRRLNHALNRFRRLAQSAPRVIAVYDSSLPGDRDVSTAGSVEVRFAQEDRLADEEVVAIAGETAGPVFVVSTDREVREGSEAAGAVALWSQGLVSWIKSAV
jgi:predicted RNA-binding protein with PIN domain